MYETVSNIISLVLVFKYSKFSPQQKLRISLPSNQLPGADEFLRSSLKVLTTSDAGRFYINIALGLSPLQAFSDPILSLFREECPWFGQPSFSRRLSLQV